MYTEDTCNAKLILAAFAASEECFLHDRIMRKRQLRVKICLNHRISVCSKGLTLAAIIATKKMHLTVN